jgi:hypothetical protein
MVVVENAIISANTTAAANTTNTTATNNAANATDVNTNAIKPKRK